MSQSQSSINVAVPPQGDTLSSGTIRANFTAAANDVNYLINVTTSLQSQINNLSPTPVPTPTPTTIESADKTDVFTVGPTVIDSNGNVFAITNNQQISLGGTPNLSTADAIELYYRAANLHTVYYQDRTLAWHQWDNANQVWVSQPTAPKVQPVPAAYTQTPHTPIPGPVTVGTNTPTYVTGVAASSCVLDMTPGVTVMNRAALDQQAYYRLLGNAGADLTNFAADYEAYNAYLSDGVTRDPRDLHLVLSDHFALIARSTLASDSDATPYKCAAVRVPVYFGPGSVIEVKAQWPANRWSCARIALISGQQILADSQNQTYTTHQPIEIDLVTGIPDDNAATPGLTVRVGNQTAFGSPSTVYASNGPNYTSDGSIDTGQVGRFVTSAGGNLTNGAHIITLDWKDKNTIQIWIDDEIVARQSVTYTGVYASDLGTPNAPTTPMLSQLVPCFLLLDHRFGYKSNTVDYAALAAAGTVYVKWIVYYIRGWNAPGTNNPAITTAAPSLPAPQTGSVLGDLPAITDGTYVFYLDPSGQNPLNDQIGTNAIRLLNPTGSQAGDKVNNLAALRFSGGSAVSITGPVCGYASSSQVVLFIAMTNRAPATGPQVIAQFVQGYPQNGVDHKKLTLTMSSSTGAIADVDVNGTNYSAFLQDGKVVSAASGVAAQNTVIVLSMTLSIGIDGTLGVGMGFDNTFVAPVSSGGIARTDITGFTELLIGAGRQTDGQITRGAEMLLLGAVCVSVANGGSLSQASNSAVVNKLLTKFGGTSTSGSTSGNNGTPTGFQPGSLAATLSGIGFTWLNQGSAAVSGSGPLTVTDPAGDNQTRALLTPMLATTGSWVIKINEAFGAIDYYSCGIIMAKQGADYFTTLNILSPTSSGSNITVNKWTSVTSQGTFLNGSGSTAVKQATDCWIKVVIDSTNITWLVSGTGLINSWTQIAQAAYANVGPFDYVGLSMNSLDPTQTGTTLSISWISYEYQSTTNLQAAA